MPENKNKGIEKRNQTETSKKRSFFGGSLDANSKDFLDFRYNTQEEIDKLNEKMTDTSDLDEIIEQTNNIENNTNIDETSEEYLKEKDEKEAESNLEKDLDGIGDSSKNDANNDKYDEVYENKIADDDNSESETSNETILDENQTDNYENNNEKNKDEEDSNSGTHSSKFFDPFESDIDDENEEDMEGTTENFDPFELDEENVDEENANKKQDDVIIENNDNNSPEFGSESLNTETENNEFKNNEEDSEKGMVDDEEIENNLQNNKGTNESDIDEDINEQEVKEDNSDEDSDIEENIDDEEIIDDEGNVVDLENINNEEIIDEQNDEINENNEELDNSDVEVENEELNNSDVEIENEELNNSDEEVENEELNNSDVEEDDEDNITIPASLETNQNQKFEKGKPSESKKLKRNSSTGEIVTKEEIQLEQGQDMADSENDEEYQPSDEEVFEQEPEFFADDEISQQFMSLVKNVRGIFKLERKDDEQNPYFKILGGKNKDSTLEYLFYLIEEENEPLDLYIKKVEIISEEENEHLVQFSYSEDKELNILVDEVILYEKVNKSDSDSVEFNDTKAILEKFIFLTENYYDKLETEIKKLREERQKKRQLQQIFKGF